MNITWLDINASYSHSSLALPALEAQLKPEIRSRCSFSVVCGTIKSPVESIVSEVLATKASYIFATGWLFNIDYLTSVLARVSAIDNSIRIILGGPEFLGDNSAFLNSHNYVTALFKGDGEQIFNRFIEIISNEPDSLEWLSLEGFEYIDSSGNYIFKESVSTPDFVNLTPAEESEFFRWDKPFVQLETSRGCFNSCKFCVSGIDNSPVRNIPIEKIRERLENISSKGIKEIRILDRTFNANATRAVEMLNLFEEFNGRLKFHIEVHPALLAPSVKSRLESLPKGLLHIEAGIQSLDEGVLCHCARKGSAERAIEGLKFLLSLDKYEVHTDFIAGLPHYSFKMLLNDVKAMIAIAPGEIQLELLKLLPGTDFRINSNEHKIRYSPLSPYEVLQTESITYQELIKSKVLSKIIEYWYNDTKWQESFRELVVSNNEYLEKLLEELIKTPFYETLHSFESKSQLLYEFGRKHFPNTLDTITLNWIKCGLSLKKEPAARVLHWNIKDNDKVFNPLFDPGERMNSYYFFDTEDTRHWFAYNKGKERSKPINYCREEINIKM